MSLPLELTLAVVDEELPLVESYAQRHRLHFEWKPDQFELTLDGLHPVTRDKLRIRAKLDDYKAIAPAWYVEHKSDASKFPQAGKLPNGKGSIFHGQRLICAHFNRLAFADHGGPHGNWGGPSRWLEVRDNVRATSLVEMVTQIVVHLKYSPGWM